MKNKILDLIFDIEDFRHTEELLVALDAHSPLMINDTDIVLNGFYLMLKELKFDSSLQLHTLLATMANVKKQYALITFYTHTVEQVSAITLSINHVKHCLQVQKIKAKYKVA